MTTKRTPTPAAADAPVSAENTGNAEAAAETTTPVEVVAPAAPIDTAGFVEVRVLLAFDEHEPNDLALIDPDQMLGLLQSGHVDDHPNAVAYARELAEQELRA